MDKQITIGEKYKPAMAITEQSAADAYFEECVRHTVAAGYERTRAEEIERVNLGYFAGYYNDETRKRVERLFKCEHPIFGSIEANGEPAAHTVSSLKRNRGRI